MIYGYARVSTHGQSVDAQVHQLRDAGAETVYRETASGAKTERVQLARLLAQLDAGDVLMVTRLDRLARSTRDLLNTLAAIADRKAGLVARRRLGGHHHITRAADAHCARRAGRVRARPYPQTHSGRPRTG